MLRKVFILQLAVIFVITIVPCICQRSSYAGIQRLVKEYIPPEDLFLGTEAPAKIQSVKDDQPKPVVRTYAEPFSYDKFPQTFGGRGSGYNENTRGRNQFK